MVLQFYLRDFILFYIHYNQMVKPVKYSRIYFNMEKLQENMEM